MANGKKETSVFDEMPIDEWADYIEKNAKDEDEKRKLKVKAKRSLTVENMAAYIIKHDNTKKAKTDFKNSAIYQVKDEDGNFLTDEKNNIIERNSVINAASYFVDKYLPDFKLETKKKKSAFDIIADW